MKKQIKTFASLKNSANQQNDDDEEFQNIENQINNEQSKKRSQQNSHRGQVSSRLRPPHLESTTQVFEKIEEQIREESPSKSTKNGLEIEISE